MREPPSSPRENRSPRSGTGSGKSTAGGSLTAAECRVARPAERFVQRVWDTSQQAETAISGSAGNCRFWSLWEQRHCLQSSELPSTVHFEQRFQPHCNPKVRYWASRAFVYTNAQNGLPALPPEARFCLLGQRPKPFEQPLAGAGCAFGNRTLVWRVLSKTHRNKW